MSRSSASPSTRWPLPAEDDWSTPFAELLLAQLDLRPGLTILDIACGHGIPAFYLAEQVGPTGSVLGIDMSRGQVANAKNATRRKQLRLQNRGAQTEAEYTRGP